MLEVKNLGVTIEQTEILKPQTFSVDSGSTLAILGRNGAGKSTLVKGIAGLNPTNGEVLIDGEALAHMSPKERSRLIGYVAQDFGSSDVRLSVFELLVLAQNSHNLSFSASEESLQNCEQMLKLLHLEHLADRHPYQMSGGQRQMVALALALIRKPRLLLLDEPTSALDLANQFQLLEIVKDYTRRHSITTLMVLHDLNLAHRYADHTLLLEQGQRVAFGPTREVLTAKQIEQSYGVRCETFTASDGAISVHPLAAL